MAIITDVCIEANFLEFVKFEEAITFNSNNLGVISSENKTYFANKVALCTSGTTGYFNVIVYSGKQITFQLKSVLSILKKAPIKTMEISNNIKFLVFFPPIASYLWDYNVTDIFICWRY